MAFQQSSAVESIQAIGDGWVLGAAVVALLMLVAVGEALRRWDVRPTTSRRFVHVGVGLFVAATPYLFSGPGPVYVLAGCFVVGNAVARARRWWPGVHAARPRSIGTVTFPLAVFPALLLAWRADAMHTWAISVAFLILAIADPVAAWVGTRYGQPHAVAGAAKSWAGSIAFVGCAWGISVLTLWGTGAVQGLDAIAIGLVVAVTAAGAEALGGRGWDNFFVVVAAVVPLVMWGATPSALPVMAIGLGAGVVFAAMTWRMQWLSRSGALAGGLLAASLIGLGGAAWAVPAFAFFVLSSGLSRVGPRQKRRAAARSEKGAVRDAGQVYANGALGWTLLIVHATVVEDPLLYWGFLGAFAAAAADTWATELGTLARGRPRLITTGRVVETGTSGAVSGWGTLASAAGAASVAISAWAVAPGAFAAAGSIAGIGFVTGAGIGGALADSLVGATLQAQYAGLTGGRSERPSGRLVQGYRWLTNDRVNIICTLTGALLGGAGSTLWGA